MNETTYIYVCHSDINENNIYAEFATEEEAIDYARNHADELTYVDKVEVALDEAGDILEVFDSETIWVAELELENFEDEDDFFAFSDEEVECQTCGNIVDTKNCRRTDGGHYICEACCEEDFDSLVEKMEENEEMVECKECFELFPKQDGFKIEVGYLCPHCHKPMANPEIEATPEFEVADEDTFKVDFPEYEKFKDTEDDFAACEGPECEEPVTEVEEMSTEEVISELVKDAVETIESCEEAKELVSADPDANNKEDVLDTIEDIKSEVEEQVEELEELLDEVAEEKVEEEESETLNESVGLPKMTVAEIENLLAEDRLEFDVEDEISDEEGWRSVDSIVFTTAYSSAKGYDYMSFFNMTDQDGGEVEGDIDYYKDFEELLAAIDGVYADIVDEELVEPVNEETELVDTRKVGYHSGNPIDYTDPNWIQRLDIAVRVARKRGPLTADVFRELGRVRNLTKNLNCNSLEEVENLLEPYFEYLPKSIYNRGIKAYDEIVSVLPEILWELKTGIPVDHEGLDEQTHAQYAKPEGDRKAAYNNALTYAKKHNADYIYGYTNHTGKFFALDQPIKMSEVAGETEKEFRNKYKNCSTVFVAYRDKDFIKEEAEAKVVCGWCNAEVLESDCKHDVDFGPVCSHCQEELMARGEEIIEE